MAYPQTQRPPLEHQGDSSFSNSGAYDPERGASAHSLTNKLRKPSGWGLHHQKSGDLAQGDYLELHPTESQNQSPSPNHQGHHHQPAYSYGGRGYDNLTMPSGEVPMTKVNSHSVDFDR